MVLQSMRYSCLLTGHLSVFGTKFLRNMASRVTVRFLEGEERLDISLRYGQDGGKERIFNLCRSQNEELGKCLSRLQTNVTNKLSKKKKQKVKVKPVNVEGAGAGAGAGANLPTEEPEIELGVFRDNVRLGENVLNKHAWLKGSVLHIGDEKLPLILNLPRIKSVKMQQCFMAGFPIFPRIELEFANLELCDFSWSVAKVMERPWKAKVDEHDSPTTTLTSAQHSEEKSGIVETDCESESNSDRKQQMTQKKTNTKSQDEGQSKKIKLSEWIAVSSEKVFTPQNSHINHRIKFTCTPKNKEMSGDPVTIEPLSGIEAGPGMCPFEKRWQHTKEMTSFGCFRVVSYNILADLYADSDFSRNVLYPYCPPYALEIDYRKQLYMKELIGYNADIICLQEVDRRAFVNDIKPSFSLMGMESLQMLKAGEVNEGMATCYRTSKFKLLGQHGICLSEELKNKPALKGLLEKVSAKESLKEKILARTTVVQVTVLESVDVPGEVVITANTHLYFHPKANHIRLIQIITAMEHLKEGSSEYTSQGKHVSVVFCGDFNSTPPVGVNEYMTTGQVSADHPDWSIGGAEETMETEDGYHHSFTLESGCGYPVYTNFVGGFCGTLDYIYIDNSRLKVKSVVPNPDDTDVTQYTALPSIVFPSDHIAQICDLEFKQNLT